MTSRPPARQVRNRQFTPIIGDRFPTCLLSKYKRLICTTQSSDAHCFDNNERTKISEPARASIDSFGAVSSAASLPRNATSYALRAATDELNIGNLQVDVKPSDLSNCMPRPHKTLESRAPASLGSAHLRNTQGRSLTVSSPSLRLQAIAPFGWSWALWQPYICSSSVSEKKCYSSAR